MINCRLQGRKQQRLREIKQFSKAVELGFERRSFCVLSFLFFWSSEACAQDGTHGLLPAEACFILTLHTFAIGMALSTLQMLEKY